MEDLKERLAYLKGLVEGLDLDDNSKEGKLFLQIINLMDGMTTSIENLEADNEELYDYMEAVDQDLTELENDYYEALEDDEEEYDGFSIECPDCQEIVYIDDNTIGDEEMEMEVLCPRCHQVVFVQDELWEGDSEVEDLEEDQES